MNVSIFQDMSKTITEEQYRNIIQTLRNGYRYRGITHRSNDKVTLVLIFVTFTDLDVDYILNLTLSKFSKKTKFYTIKTRETKAAIEIPNILFDYIKQYSENNLITSNERLFKIQSESLKKLLIKVHLLLGYRGLTIESYRDFMKNNYLDSMTYSEAIKKCMCIDIKLPSGLTYSFNSANVFRENMINYLRFNGLPYGRNSFED